MAAMAAPGVAHRRLGCAARRETNAGLGSLPVNNHVFVDETKRRGYLLVASVVILGEVDALRRTLRGLVLPGQRWLHMKTRPATPGAAARTSPGGCMSRFSERHGYRRPPPARTELEDAPDDLRAVLHSVLVGDQGEVGAYRLLCAALHKTPNSQIWGDTFARSEVLRLIENLEWYEVFDLLEEHATGRYQVEEVNDSFVREGLAYEMIEGFGSSEIYIYDPEGDELEVIGTEDDAANVLAGQFAPVKDQYLRALTALRARPADDEKAISEALGALEAVARILGGRQDFAANMSTLFRGSPPWANPLAASLKSLYGYGSQVPGARHGRYTDPLLEHEDALYVVRACGSAITYLVAGNRSGRWS